MSRSNPLFRTRVVVAALFTVLTVGSVGAYVAQAQDKMDHDKMDKMDHDKMPATKASAGIDGTVAR